VHPDRARPRLVQLLREKGIRDERVLEAVGRVQRHAFVEQGLRHRAYADEALPIGLGQTISQPFTVAYQTAMLETQPFDRVLEVGTGSGYQAAILCELEARVFSVERHKPLLQDTAKLLKSLGYRVRTRHGDGAEGWRAYAPYDGIVVTAGAIDIPQALLNQLREPEAGKRGGRLVIPVGGPDGQVMRRITRTGPDTYEEEVGDTFRFVPFVGS
jgi:protein-L-isoaspartate(D-aspartate) O-methyltransferase